MKSYVNASNHQGFGYHARPMPNNINGMMQLQAAFPAQTASQVPLQQQLLQQQQQQAWHVTLQAIPSSVVSSNQAAMLRGFHPAIQQQQQQHQQQQQMFYPEHLRGQFLKPQFQFRHSSPVTSDSMSLDAMPLEPKRRTRRRRRRARKTDFELAALVHIPDTSCSPTDMQDDDDYDCEDYLGAQVFEEQPLHSASTSSSTLSVPALSAYSNSSRSSMEFDAVHIHVQDQAVLCKDPWQTSEDDDSYDDFAAIELVVGDEQEPSTVSSCAAQLGSCTSQLVYSDDESTMEGRLESNLKLALAWHAQLGATPYFSGMFY